MIEQFPVPQIVERPEQHLAVVRERVAFDALPELYDRAYPQIFGALARAGVAPVSAPMGVTHGEPDAELDLSVAVPVAQPFSPDGPVGAETLPAGRAATLLVKGDYALLPAAYKHLFAWISEQGLAPTGISWEQYLTEPEPGGDPAENETLIGVALQD